MTNDSREKKKSACSVPRVFACVVNSCDGPVTWAHSHTWRHLVCETLCRKPCVLNFLKGDHERVLCIG